MKETLETLLFGVSSVSSDIEQYSDWAEHNRRLHQDSFSANGRAKVPRLFLPESLGGLEVDPVTCARVCEEIALIDSAAAWHVMVFNSAKLMASTWPTELVESLWLGNADQLVAARSSGVAMSRRMPPGAAICMPWLSSARAPWSPRSASNSGKCLRPMKAGGEEEKPSVEATTERMSSAAMQIWL